jgi:putative ABC transport system permease protein
MLRKSPGTTLVAVLSLAIAIGVNTSLFSVVYGILLRPLPYPAPEQLVQIWETSRQQNRRPVSPYNLIDWRNGSNALEQINAYQSESFILTGGDVPERLNGVLVSANFFDTLKVSPQLGRGFAPEEDQPGQPRVVVLSYKTWRERFGAREDLIGRAINLNNESFTVIGVMPPSFQFPTSKIELWATPAFNLAKVQRGSRFLYAVGRLRAGSSLAAAQEEMNATAQRLSSEYKEVNDGSGVILVPLLDQVAGKVRGPLLTLWAAGLLVLIIASSNVATLLLVSSAGRRREIAVRAALGATRGRLLRQFLIESVMLAIISGALGMLWAYWGTKLVVASAGTILPRPDSISMDGWVLVFTLLVSVLTGIVFGLVPAFSWSENKLRSYLANSIGNPAVRPDRARFKGLLLTSEFALTLILLIIAGLFIKSFWRLREVDPGFDPNGVLTMQLSLPDAKFAAGNRRASFMQDAINQISTLPGVHEVGAIDDLPFSGSRSQTVVTIYNTANQPSPDPPQVDIRTVTPGYFRAMRIGLLRGREFTQDGDFNSSPVALINEAMARQYLWGEEPIGRRIEARGKMFEVVGLVENVKQENLSAEPQPEMYLSYMQANLPAWSFLVIHADEPQAQLVQSIKEAVSRIDKTVPVYNIEPMEQRLSKSFATRRFNSLLLGIFGGFTLILGASGIYAVISHSIAQRTKELGIRIALGARRSDVLKLVLTQIAVYISAGLILGVGGAFAVTRIISSSLYGVRPTDPAIFALSSVTLIVVALLATSIPALRATRVDPLIALRSEQ